MTARPDHGSSICPSMARPCAAGSKAEWEGAVRGMPVGNKRVSGCSGNTCPRLIQAKNRSPQLNHPRKPFPQSVASSGMKDTSTQCSCFLPKLLSNRDLPTQGGSGQKSLSATYLAAGGFKFYTLYWEACKHHAAGRRTPR